MSSGIEKRIEGVRVEAHKLIFSIAVPEDKQASVIIYKNGTNQIKQEVPLVSGDWNGCVRTAQLEFSEMKRLEYNYRIDEQVVTDPMAKLVVGRTPFGGTEKREEHSVRGVIVFDQFDWGTEEHAPEIPYEDSIFYQLHVRGFTREKHSGVRHKGTFMGLQEKIPYLKSLGVTQAVLMPAYEFDEIMREKPAGHLSPNGTETQKLNYWGYLPGNYYAPKFSYSSSDRPDIEMKEMVKAFHAQNMEVIMQFSFQDSVDTSMISDCLIWWVQEYHIDGFVLFTDQSTACELASNPFLGHTKMITGYYPPEKLNIQNGFSCRWLAESNDGFKVDARKMLKGDEDQLSAFVSRIKYHPEDKAVVNYITDHDGFTMYDLVAYDKKHNEENGENGRDGAVYNYSWNCGFEGYSRKKSIRDMRMRQMRNAFSILLLSQGVPMLLAGDEFCNSQNGNNNPYCHDSELTWTDWSKAKTHQDMIEFVKELICLRRQHSILHSAKRLTGSDTISCGYPDFSCHGSRAWYGVFEHVNRHIGLMYCGYYEDVKEFVYVAYNFHWDAQLLALPVLPEGMQWVKIMDTETRRPEGQWDSIAEKEKMIQVPGRCVQVLTAELISEVKGDVKEDAGEV